MARGAGGRQAEDLRGAPGGDREDVLRAAGLPRVERAHRRGDRRHGQGDGRAGGRVREAEGVHRGGAGGSRQDPGTSRGGRRGKQRLKRRTISEGRSELAKKVDLRRNTMDSFVKPSLSYCRFSIDLEDLYPLETCTENK